MTFHFPSRSIRARGLDILTTDQLRRAIPAVFAETAHESRSDKFVPIATTTLLDRLNSAGFDVVAAKQSGTRTPGKEAFTRHELRLRARGLALKRNDVFPEIILSNGNDGTAAYTITAGLFRLVCENGLTVGAAQFEGFRVAHTGRAAAILDSVIDATATVVSETTRALDTAAHWQSVTLSQDAQDDLAQRASQLRWGAAAPINAHRLLTARRPGDHANDAWTAFNRVQENIIHGGFEYRLPNTRPGSRRPWQTRRVGEVAAIADDRRINRGLWDATAALVAA